VDKLKQTPVEEQKVEIVERKGLGHPDTICDSIMDEVSVRLSREYVERFGAVMHHNIDKSLLVAGSVETRFGGGFVRNPMRLIFGDRATFRMGDFDIPVKQIAVQTAKEWFKKNLRYVDPEKHVTYQVEIQPGSPALTSIFRGRGGVLGANDTSAAVGWAPLTKTEKTVLDAEKHLNSKEFKSAHPETGEDVKVMGLRKGSQLELTISMAFVDRFIGSEQEYFDRKENILEEIEDFVHSKKAFQDFTVQLNALDTVGRREGGIYLTVLGTSGEQADSGEVGRGNRVNGLISLNRPQCSEAAAGKNPVSHVGKIYNLLTHKIAQEIYSEVSGVREVYVWMLSKIGRPIDQPAIASVQIIGMPNISNSRVKKEAERIVDYQLENIDKFCTDLTNGKIPVC